MGDADTLPPPPPDIDIDFDRFDDERESEPRYDPMKEDWREDLPWLRL